MSTECYVCYEPCIDKAPCLCKTLYVHPSCITILRMYGNKECGVCKTPFDDTDIVDLVLAAPPPSPPLPPREIEEPYTGPPDPPYLCLFLCVSIRCGRYRTTETDLACDTLRILAYLLFVYFLLSIFAPWVRPNFLIFILVYMFIIGVYNIINHIIRKRDHRRRLQELREPMEV